MDYFKNFTQNYGKIAADQTSQLQSFANNVFGSKPNMSTTSGPKTAPAPIIQPKTSITGGASQAGVNTANSMPLRDPNEGRAGYGYWSQNGWVSGMGLTDPTLNPTAVNVAIDNEIPSDALNITPSSSTQSEKRKKKENNVLNSRYSKEEDELLKEIASFRTGLAGLGATQAKEYYDLQKNPDGVFGEGVLSGKLNRLSTEQAIELNARVGQMNAMLDNLEMYQGYRPQMVGTPQIDETTGEAFAYIQDPMTGELAVQPLGQIMTPSPYSDLMTLGEGQTVYDPTTGEALYTAPKSFSPSSGSGGYVSGGRLDTSGLDITDPSQIDALPVSVLTKAIMNGTGTIKDLTPTDKAIVLAEMYQVGFNPQQYVINKLNGLVDLWSAIPSGKKGIFQGWANPTGYFSPEVAAFESSKSVLTRIVARLYDVGMLSDQDVEDYKKAMPSRLDNNIDVVNAKVSGITQAVTGKSPQDSYSNGDEVQLDDGRIARFNSGKWYDSFSGELIENVQ